jgi:hypothetical protein
MTTAAALVNPLSLPMEYRASVTPLHEADDDGKLAALTASMTEHGWAGAPLVADRELASCGQDRAYTGSHRLAAWSEARECEPVPCVYIEDLCEALGIDWDALMDDAEGNSYDAATELCYRLSDDIREAYGLDVGGA